MEYSDLIKECEEKIAKLKGSNYISQQINEQPIIKQKTMFSGIMFDKDMCTSELTDDRLTLAHCFIHNLYSLKRKSVDSGDIFAIHSKLVNEMKTRGKSHMYNDALDEVKKNA